MQSKSVLLLGATGAVGGECLKLLARYDEFVRVIAPTRRPIDLPSPKIENIIVDFDNPASYPNLNGIDAVICALGTTAAKAKSIADFKRVDYEYPLAFAKLARQSGVKHFLIISSAGANPTARIYYYKIKAEIESALTALEFPALTIIRPALIEGNRPEFRLKEAFAIGFARALGPLLPIKYRPATDAVVARALVESAKLDAVGKHIIRNPELLQF